MRLVLDTNVLISGIFFGGLPGRIVTAWRNSAVRIVTSPEILSEYADVLGRLAAKRPGIDPYPILALLAANSECVESPHLSEPVCDDPDDDKFFACAVASGVSVIVSGDSHLLVRSGYRASFFAPPKSWNNTQTYFEPSCMIRLLQDPASTATQELNFDAAPVRGRHPPVFEQLAG